VVGEGMPLAREPTTRGDLILKFDIDFPAELTLDQKAKLRAVLPA
jgi:DnaJ-class molecular chaperone